MEKFEISERYRKYLIEIKINDKYFYTVWGTDLNDNENDKLLVKDKKLLLFKNKNSFVEKKDNLKNIFYDDQNFENWLNHESFEEPYSSTNFDTLKDISGKDLRNKETGLEIINTLNLIHDFYIQIQEDQTVFSSNLLLSIKDYLYNQHFWKNDNPTKKIPFNLKQANAILKKIYMEFIQKIEYS